VAPNDHHTCICSATPPPSPPPPQHGHTAPCQPHELEPYQHSCRDNELQPPIWIHAPEQAPPPPALLLLVLGAISSGAVPSAVSDPQDKTSPYTTGNFDNIH